MIQARVVLIAAAAALAAACAATPPQPAGPDLSGNWILTTESQMGAQDSDMTVVQTGRQLSGTLTSQMGTVEYSGSLEGEAIQFGFAIDMGGQSLQIDYSGVVAGDTMSGKAIFGSFGEGTFIAKRKAL